MPSAETNTNSTQKERMHRRVHGVVKHHYYKRMPNRRRYRLLVWAIFFLLSSIIAAQLLYPPTRALPLVSLQGEQIGFAKEDAVSFRVHELFKQMNVRVEAGEGKVVESELASIGGEADASKVTQALTKYPFWQRFIPLSILLHRQSVDTVEVQYNQALLDTFTQRASQELTTEPQNARLAIELGQLVAVDDISGRTVTAAQLQEAIVQPAYALGETQTVRVKAAEQPADTTAADLAAVRYEAEAALERAVQIVAEGEVVREPTASERAQWIELAHDSEQNISLRFDQQALKRYLSSLNDEIGAAAGTTVVHLRDGKETRRVKGAEGRVIAYEPLVADIEAWVMRAEGASQAAVVFETLRPTVRYERSYTSSQQGLQAYVTDASRAQNAAIVVHQTSGPGWKAQARGTQSMPSASTYKLYIAWMLFEKIDSGDIRWGDAMRDTNVAGCFNRMVVASLNQCAEQWIGEFGRANINAFLYSRGYSQGTSFTMPAATHTTAQDLAKFMVSLERSDSIKGANRDRLLGAISSHSFRQGVPAGSKGKVWNKVGFLWDYVHDAALVHHPKGNYVIVVMTKGRSYATIAEITRQVEQIMYN